MRPDSNQEMQQVPPAIAAVLALIVALFVGVLIQAWPSSAHAEEAVDAVSGASEGGANQTNGASAEGAASETAPAEGGGEEALDLDALEEPPAASPEASGGGGVSALGGKVRIMGRFDATYELTNPAEDDHKIRNGDIKSYHHNIFVKVNASEQVGLFGEVIDGLFYEFSYRPTQSVELKAGKIIVPFGDPGFHHFYGAVQGDPTTGIFVPNVWAEYGAVGIWELGHLGPVGFTSESYAVKGFYEKDVTKVLMLNKPATGNRFAIGERLGANWGKVRTSASVYYDEWNLGNDLFLYGVDVSLDYGLVRLPFLQDLRFKAGLARAEVENPETGDYYKYADYVELAYGGLSQWVTPRLRYGSYIDDSRVIAQKDIHNWSGALVVPIDVLTLTTEYLWQMEEVDEMDNDLFRMMLALDF